MGFGSNILHLAKLIVKNTSTLDKGEKNNSWYIWTLSIDAEPQSVLDQIQSVKYHLHPTFPNPEILIEKSLDNRFFELKGRGWGEFVVTVQIMGNGFEYDIKHHLKLGSNTRHMTEKRIRLNPTTDS